MTSQIKLTPTPGVDVEKLIDENIDTDVIAPVQTDNDSVNIGTKFGAVLFLEGACNIIHGLPVPDFDLASRVLELPKNKLKAWWKDKDAIRRVVDKSASAFYDTIALQLRQSIQKVVAELMSRDMSSMTNRELIDSFQAQFKIYRLVMDQSTENIAEKHHVRIDSHVRIR